MINLSSVSSTDLIMMYELGKLIKATEYAYYVFNDDTLVVYGAQDFMFSTISRIIVPNTTDIRGTIAIESGELKVFCMSLVPLMQVEIIGNWLINPTSKDNCAFDTSSIEYAFIEKRCRINESLDDPNLFRFSIDEDTKRNLRDSLTMMRASTNQKFFKLANGYLITIYSGFIPINKADVLNIDVLSSTDWFICKYEILKKRAPAPIHLFTKYRRL